MRGTILAVLLVAGAVGALAFLAAGLLDQDPAWLTIGIACAAVSGASGWTINRLKP